MYLLKSRVEFCFVVVRRGFYIRKLLKPITFSYIDYHHIILMYNKTQVTTTTVSRLLTLVVVVVVVCTDFLLPASPVLFF